MTELLIILKRRIIALFLILCQDSFLDLILPNEPIFLMMQDKNSMN